MFRSLVLLLGVICLFGVVAVVGGGLARDWFSIRSNNDPVAEKSEPIDLNLKIDTGKIEADLATAKEKVEEFIEPVTKESETALREPVQGTVEAIDESGTRIQVRVEDEVVDFEVNEQTRIRSEGREATLLDLQVGDRVEIHPSEDGERIALEIEETSVR